MGMDGATNEGRDRGIDKGRGWLGQGKTGQGRWGKGS